MAETTTHRGYLAVNEEGEFGVIVDFFRGRYTGFVFPADGHGWSSKDPDILFRIGVRGKPFPR